MRRTTDAAAIALITAAVAAVASGCTSSSPTTTDPGCVSGLSPTCSATYDPPTYDTIYTKILHPTCAAGTTSCHSEGGHKNGLVFENADASYALLLGQNGAPARVKPGDPSCSLIMKRLTATDPNYHMPPGTESLSPGDQCTIVQWIAQGAKR